MRGEIKKTAVEATTTARNTDKWKISNEIIADPSNFEKVIKLHVSENILVESPRQDILAAIISENTFVNPKYIANEEQGYSNWNTSEKLETYQPLSNGSIVVPIGYGPQLMHLCKKNGMDIDLNDLRTVSPISYPASLKGITLRPYQERAVHAALTTVQGTIVSPTGSGKSLIGLEIIRRRQQKAILIVHRTDLAKQWIAGIKKNIGLRAGFIGDGQWTVGKQITVAMVQTLATRQQDSIKLKDQFGLILVDEAHHTPSETFFEVMGKFSARYRYGLSATIERRDGLMSLIFLAIGPQIATIERKEVEQLRATVPAKIKAIETGFNPGVVNSWNQYLDSLTTNADRNLFILDIAKKAKSPTLILCDRVAHADDLSGIMTRRNINHALVHGKVKDREEAMTRIKNATITVGTTGLLGEGLDVPFWECLIMASPISSEIKLLQAIGRVVRASPGKKNAVIFDLKDNCGFSGASFKKRFEIYRKHNIFVEFKK